MLQVVEKLKGKRLRSSTATKYLAIWRQFNNFVIKLDRKPNLWEDRALLFCAYLIEEGAQSQTVRSYMSAIKGILIDDGYLWNDNQMLISSLTRACKLENDVVKSRLPIQSGLLELLLFEIKREFGGKQPYLEATYLAMFALSYYGLLRIGELTSSEHALKAKDIQVGTNKDKILIVLRSSKTHGKESPPQLIKISAVNGRNTDFGKHRFFCPFTLTRNYLALRGEYESEDDFCFVFRDNKPVSSVIVRETLRLLLKKLNLNDKLYDTQSFRIGRSVDLMKMKIGIDQLKLMGRWKSNTVYKYLRHCSL